MSAKGFLSNTIKSARFQISTDVCSRETINAFAASIVDVCRAVSVGIPASASKAIYRIRHNNVELLQRGQQPSENKSR
jgi:hypothetical protein